MSSQKVMLLSLQWDYIDDDEGEEYEKISLKDLTFGEPEQNFRLLNKVITPYPEEDPANWFNENQAHKKWLLDALTDEHKIIITNTTYLKRSLEFLKAERHILIVSMEDILDVDYGVSSPSMMEKNGLYMDVYKMNSILGDFPNTPQIITMIEAGMKLPINYTVLED